MKQLLVEKYRPSTIDEYIFQNKETEKVVKKWLNSGEIPNVLMVSDVGQGKTTLSRILVNELGVDDIDVLTVNASSENGIGFVRERLEPWLKTSPIGKFKVVQLEEMDRLSPQAMDALRSVIEDHSDIARFIGTCNYANKISGPILSRFQKIDMDGMDEDSILDLLEKVIEEEKIIVNDVDDVLLHIEKYYPDVRSILQSIDKCTDSDNVLHPPQGESFTGGDVDKWEELWSKKNIDVADLLTESLVLTELVDNNNFEEFYEAMYTNSHQFPDEAMGIVHVSNYLSKAMSSANQRLHLDACLYHIFLIGGEDDE